MISIQLPSGHMTLVSDADFDRVSQFKWSINSSGYAQRSIGKTKQALHRFILSVPDGIQVDHINGNRLDNRRENLRLCTVAQNQRNRSKRSDTKSRFKGVSKNWGNYCASHSVGPRGSATKTHLGQFSTEEAAARAYDRAAHSADPEFAKLNFADGIWSEEQLEQFRLRPTPAVSGFYGVVRNGNNWAARFKVNGKMQNFGTYKTRELANEAVIAAKAKLQPIQ